MMHKFSYTSSNHNMGLIALGLLLVLAAFASQGVAQEALTVDGSGNVGIGTTTPDTHVHVEGTGVQIFTIESTGSSVADITLKNTGNSWGFRSNSVGDFSIVDRTAAVLVVTIKKGSPTNSIRIDSTGNVGVGGITTPSKRLHVVDSTLEGAVLRLEDNTTVCDADPEPGEPVWSCPSDARLKTNLRAADTASILHRLGEIQLYDYELVSTGTSHMGPVAQDLLETQPERVTQAEDGTLMVSLPGRAELLGAVQELQKEIVEMRRLIGGLQEELAAAKSH